MKVFNTIAKVLAALATVAGIVYLAATYGDKIVAWAKKLLGCCSNTVEETEVTEEVTAEEAPAEEAPVEAEPETEAPAEVTVEEGEPVAEENDFEA